MKLRNLVPHLRAAIERLPDHCVDDAMEGGSVEREAEG